MQDYTNWNKLQEKLRELTGLAYYNSQKTELICRCPFPNCEIDENRLHSHGRLYIDTNIPVFNCFRCNRSGSIFKLFRQLNISISEFLNLDHELFNQINKPKDLKIDSNKLILEHDIKMINKSDIQDIYKNKILYLKGRMGFDNDVSKIPNIIFNIRKFVELNNIKLNYRDEQALDIYDRNYIGFLGNRGSVLILRNVEGKEYHKIQLFPSGHFKDFYGLWTNAISEGQINKIVLCEGIFDLLIGLKSSALAELRSNTCFWAATLGSYYKRLVPSVLEYIKLTYVDVIILSDKDKSPDDKIYSYLRESPLIRNMEIYWNKSGHDFGQLAINPVKQIYKDKNGFSNFRKPLKLKSYR
jgi:hypothetical protein